MATNNNQDPNVIDIRIGKVWFDAHANICYVRLSPDANVSLEDMQESIEAQEKQIGENKKAALLIDIRDIQGSTREAREYAAKAERKSTILAQALLANSTVGTILGNLFINFNRPPSPTKLFTSEDKAIAWLKGFSG